MCFTYIPSQSAFTGSLQKQIWLWWSPSYPSFLWWAVIMSVPRNTLHLNLGSKISIIFFLFFYIFFMFLNLTYIVCVSKWHKIHKNTILLCNITLFLIHPSIFSLISLAYFNATLAANIVRGLFLTEILPQLGLLKCHNNNYFCCLLPNLAFLTLK